MIEDYFHRKLYALWILTVYKIKFFLNRNIANQEKVDNYSIKNALFDILSLANRLYKSKSTNLNSFDMGKIYFFEKSDI